MEKVIFDLDPGVDDSMALILGLNHPEIQIKLITTTFGNVGIEQTTKNACYIAENFGGKDVKVYSGFEHGIKASNINASHVHGKTGLGAKIVAVDVNKKASNKEGYGAIEAMRDMVLENPGEINIVSVGPATNVAKLILKYPAADLLPVLSGLIPGLETVRRVML